VAEARIGQELPAPTMPEIAFAGRSNVGKSTLLNRLCQRKSLARTSRTPGCTRGVVLFHAALRDGTNFVIADLPGYGFADRSKAERDAWAGLIERYLRQRASLAGVVILVDSRRGIEPEEEQLISYLEHIHRPFMVAVTKVDKLTRVERDRAIAAVRNRTRTPVIGVSGESGEGREEILRRIRGLVKFDPVPSQGGTVSSAADVTPQSR
jgi:GTP-binding protein